MTESIMFVWLRSKSASDIFAKRFCSVFEATIFHFSTVKVTTLFMKAKVANILWKHTRASSNNWKCFLKICTTFALNENAVFSSFFNKHCSLLLSKEENCPLLLSINQNCSLLPSNIQFFSIKLSLTLIFILYSRIKIKYRNVPNPTNTIRVKRGLYHSFNRCISANMFVGKQNS